MAKNTATNGPSPKRRRTDDGPPSAKSIAQSNATLHLLTGQRQRQMQDRWINGHLPTSPVNGGLALPRQAQTGRASISDVNTTANAARNNHAQNSTAHQLNRAEHQLQLDKFGGTTAVGQNSAGMSSSNHNIRLNAEGTPVVEYNSPAALRGSDMVSNNRDRASMEGSVRATTQQGLPSPAPSDENTNSPVAVDATLPPRRGPGRPSKYPRPASPKTGTARLLESRATHTMSNAPGQPARPSQLPQPSIHVPSQIGVNGSGSTFSPQPNPQHFPRNMSAPMPGSNGPWNVPPSPAYSGGHVAPQGRRTASPFQAMAPPAHQPQVTHIGGLFDLRQLLSEVDAQLHKYTRADPAGLSYRHDTGRLSLLREAVQKADWFYIVLSQLCCLKTTSPISLPETMRSLSAVSYQVLDGLLCSNNDLQPSLVEWFASFPRPIMSIYSSSAGRLYEIEVQRVATFLTVLPSRWQIILAESTQRNAPPLVQDMVELLGLSSPVLQTTAFRAIARSSWGSVGDGEQGIESLVTVHHWDQSAYQRGQIRNPAQKQQAYAGYKDVFEQWKAHAEKMKAFAAFQHILPVQERQRQPVPTFQIPITTKHVFGILAQPAPAPTGQVANGNMQNMHGAAAAPQRTRHPSVNQIGAPMQQQGINNNGRVATWQTQSPQAVSQAQQAPPGFMLPPTPVLRSNQPNRAVFPPAGADSRPQPTHPNAQFSALHQAHLRSPKLGAAKLTTGPLYRQVVTWALGPSRVNGDVPVQTFSFSIPSQVFHHKAETLPHNSKGQLPLRNLTESSQTYRLRCARIVANVGFQTEAAGTTADNFWPEGMYFEINNTMLETRRKLHHGRYLPIDLTDHIKEGANTVKVFVNKLDGDKKPFDFAIAVEGVGVASHQTIVTSIQVISADDSLTAIKTSLAGGTSDSDDVVMTSSTLTINLFDPISGSKIFDTPVRGQTCLHRDCFDLETFLSVAKREKPGWPSVVDTWRCPICRGDARPNQLIKDGFLMQVRGELAQKGLLDTRAIVVEADGTWKPKVEERTGVRSPSLEREERASSAVVKVNKPAPVVIELD